MKKTIKEKIHMDDVETEFQTLLYEIDNNMDYYESVKEVYSSIGDGIYRIISVIDEDKTIMNWINYGYQTDFKTE